MTQEPRAKSSEEMAKELLGEFMKDVAEKKKIARATPPPPPRSSVARVAVLVAVMVAVVGWNVYSLTRGGDVFSREEARASAQVQLLLAVQGVQAYREANGALPKGLADFGYHPSDGVTYAVENGRYRLSFSTATETYTYREGEPLEAYKASMARLKHGDGR